MIYVIEAKPGLYKIGYSKSVDGAKSRLSTLQTGNPVKLEILFTTDGEISHERAIHRLLSKFRKKGEWFSMKDYADPLLKTVINLLSRYDADFVLSHSEEQLYGFCCLPRNVIPSLNYGAVGVTFNPSEFKDLRIGCIEQL